MARPDLRLDMSASALISSCRRHISTGHQMQCDRIGIEIHANSSTTLRGKLQASSSTIINNKHRSGKLMRLRYNDIETRVIICWRCHERRRRICREYSLSARFKIEALREQQRRHGCIAFRALVAPSSRLAFYARWHSGQLDFEKCSMSAERMARAVWA